jgi:hypothetical protein
MGATGLLGAGQRVVLLLLGSARLLVDLAGGETDFGQQQGHLGAGELVGLGTKDTKVEQADLLILELDDALQPGDLGLQAGEGGGGLWL